MDRSARRLIIAFLGAFISEIRIVVEDYRQEISIIKSENLKKNTDHFGSSSASQKKPHDAVFLALFFGIIFAAFAGTIVVYFLFLISDGELTGWRMAHPT